jgi:hypothetical protein
MIGHMAGGKYQNAQNWMIGVRPPAPTTHVLELAEK